jgi:hypothetical protein
MRRAYTDAEVAALKRLISLLAGEIGRSTTLLKTYLDHATTCQNEAHRMIMMAKATAMVSMLLDHVRYGAWAEAELSKQRVFQDPIAVVENMVTQQVRVASEIAGQQGKVLDVQPGETDTTDGQSAAMDKLATAPGSDTLQ